MKGIVFTVDAIFALIIAVASISILLYFHYFSSIPYSIGYKEAQAIMQQIASISIYQMQNSSTIAQAIVRQSKGMNFTWPQFMQNAYSDPVTMYAPTAPFISYIFPANGPITTGIVAGYGNIYFATSTTLYAVNASFGSARWEMGENSIVSTPVLYNNMLVFINATNITAVNPLTGGKIWTTNTLGTTSVSSLRITTPLLAYDNKIFFGASSEDVYAIDAENGILLWSVSLGTGQQPQFIAIVGGNLAVKTLSGEIALIGMQGNTAGMLWSKSPVVTSAIASEQDVLYFGNGDYVNATYTNGTTVPGFPGGTSQVVYAVAPYNNAIYYQLQSGLLAVPGSGSTPWPISMPSYFGSAVESSSSLIASSGYIYALWQNGLAIINATTLSLTFIRIPQSYLPLENMSAAYGHIYVVAGSRVLSFGSCPASASDSVLYASAELFANGFGSCADSLLNSVKNTAYYDVFVNNTFGPSISIAKFNGNNAYAQAQNEQQLNNSLATVSFWLNISSYPATSTRILSYGDNDTTTGHYSGWFFTVNSSGLVRFYIMNGTGQTFINSSFKLSTNTWYNVVGMYNGSYLGLYINGVLASRVGPRFGPKKISTSIIPPGSSINLTIGSGTPISNTYFNGYLSNIQIYSQPLPPASIATIYEEGLQSSPLSGYGLVAWYPLQGDANDYSKYSNPAFPFNIQYQKAGYLPQSYMNAFEISRAMVPVAILNYTTGNMLVENAGVLAWR